MATTGIVKTSQETDRVVRNDDEDPYANLSYLHPLNRLPAKTPKENELFNTDFENNFYKKKFDNDFFNREIDYIEKIVRAKFEHEMFMDYNYLYKTSSKTKLNSFK